MEEREAKLPKGTLVADAGASKVDWAIGTDRGVSFARTSGVNPYFQDAERIRKLIEGEQDSFAIPFSEVEQLHFYGAGCSSEIHQERVRRGLSELFPKANIKVQHDLLGAARASAGNEPSIVAILGTGSNACSYDGKRIVGQSGGLGFILSDEGSGAHLGKLLLREHLNGDLPESIRSSFQGAFPQTREEHLEAIHRGKDSSRYLAQFAPFMKEQQEVPHIRSLLELAFSEFADRHLLRFAGEGKSVLHTVGSIGYHFRDILDPILEERGLRHERALLEPIEGLVGYHSRS